MTDFILRGDICYAAGDRTLVTRPDSYVVCRVGVCAGVFEYLPEQYASLPLYDYRNKLVIPGMADLHLHAPQFAYRGMGMDRELLDWLSAYAFPEEMKYGDLSYAERAYTLFADAMHHSATTRAAVFATIHPQATLLLMHKLENSGIVSYVGKVNMDRNAPDGYRETADSSMKATEEWLAGCRKAGFCRTYPILTPRFVPACSDELMERLGELCAENALPVQSHLSENPDEVELVRRLCPESRCYGDAYDRFSLFGSVSPCIMAHCVYSDEREIALMKERGVLIAHCPASNMNVASGIAPIRRYLDNGMRVGLGTDVAGGETESMFSAIVDAIQCSKLYHRIIDHEATPLRFEEAFHMATRGGGAFFGKVGAFEQGYAFDAVVLDDGLLPHPQGLSLSERLERAVYLGADERALVAKFVNGDAVLS